MANGRPQFRRLADVLRRRAPVPDDVAAWFISACDKAEAGTAPAVAFGLVASREDRRRRDEHLCAAVEKMPPSLSTSGRVAAMIQAAGRLELFLVDEEFDEHLAPDWHADLLAALRQAPLPGTRQLREIVGSFSKSSKNAA